MRIPYIAHTLGSRGGRARARRLSAADRRQIASLGGHARRRSLEIAARVAANFRYAEAVRALQARPTVVARVKACRSHLPDPARNTP